MQCVFWLRDPPDDRSQSVDRANRTVPEGGLQYKINSAHRNAASRRPASSLMMASQIWVVRPPCNIDASQVMTPEVTTRSKLQVRSTVVNVDAPSGRCAMHPHPQAVSANATMVAAWQLLWAGFKWCSLTSRNVHIFLSPISPRVIPSRSGKQTEYFL